jgi:hypothetical protein
MSPVTVGASLVGFAGAAIAISGEPASAPAAGVRAYGIAAMLVSAVGYALNIVLLRMRTREEDALTLVTFMNVLPALFLIPFLPFNGVLPEINAWSKLGGAAVAAVGIWSFMTFAYARAKAQTLAPFEYTGLIWSSLFGYAFFPGNPEPAPLWRRSDHHFRLPRRGVRNAFHGPAGSPCRRGRNRALISEQQQGASVALIAQTRLQSIEMPDKVDCRLGTAAGVGDIEPDTPVRHSDRRPFGLFTRPAHGEIVPHHLVPGISRGAGGRCGRTGAAARMPHQRHMLRRHVHGLGQGPTGCPAGCVHGPGPCPPRARRR